MKTYKTKKDQKMLAINFYCLPLRSNYDFYLIFKNKQIND
jgi:hypothetical protein